MAAPSSRARRRNPWQLCRLMHVAAATSHDLAALRLEFRPDAFDEACETVTIGMTAYQARLVADLLRQAAEAIERADPLPHPAGKAN